MLRGVFKVLLCVMCLAGLFVLAGAFQLRRVQLRAQPTPQSLSLADLIENGAGANAYVQPAPVYFGKPFAEKGERGWKYVWLPLYATQPPTKNPPPPEVVFRASHLRDQEDVDRFLRDAKVRGLIAQRMPSPSPWDTTLPAAFGKRHAELDESQILILVEPEVSFLDHTWGPAVVLESTTLIGAWILGGALLVFGAAGLLSLRKSKPAPLADALSPGRLRPAAVQPTQTAATPSNQEPAITCHEFAATTFMPRAIVCGVLVACVAIFGIVFTCIGLFAFKDDAQATYMIPGVGGFMVLLAAWLGWSIKQWSARAVAEIDICPTGIRWRKKMDDPLQFALWSELLNVSRVNFTVYQGMLTKQKDEVTIVTRSGERMVLSPYVLTDYPVFAELVVEGFQRGTLHNTNQGLGSFLPPKVGGSVRR